MSNTSHTAHDADFKSIGIYTVWAFAPQHIFVPWVMTFSRQYDL